MFSFQINAVNQIKEGTLLYQTGDPAASICMVLKGRIKIYTDGFSCVLGSGSFIGIPDVCQGRFFLNYEAVEDAAVYVFSASNMASIRDVIQNNKEYRGIMIASLCRQTVLFAAARNQLLECAGSTCRFLSELYQEYTKAGAELPPGLLPADMLANLAEFQPSKAFDKNLITYYTECSNVPFEIQKAYFSSLVDAAARHVEEMAGLLAIISKECKNAVQYIKDSARLLYPEGGFIKNLFEGLIRLKKQKLSHQAFENLPKQIIFQLNRIAKIIEENTGFPAGIDSKKTEQLYAAFLANPDFEREESKESIEDNPKKEQFSEEAKKEAASLINAMDQILRFAKFDPEQANRLKQAVQYFKQSNDRLSTEDAMRLVKKEISTAFYPLYYAVFLKAREADDIPKSVRLFLDYGFLDESLLEEEQLLELCSIQPDTNPGPCKVYTMCEWLEKIYQRKKDTSKNELDENFTSIVRNDRKRNLITDAEEAELYQDSKKLLEFEINHMFKSNNKITNGHISTFVPILYQEMFVTSISKSRLTKQRINEILQKYIALDYSVFHYNMLYTKPELRITKEYIIKTVYPNIIFTPIAGQQASMWQETSNRRKDTPARFIFPVFLQGNLEDQMLKMLARFRWEICRNVQGSAWNNIQDKSLTSEYCDYLQFYRKNNDLSDEKKEKLKMQIQKARNSSREVFVQDYEVWMKNESTGAVRLNKVVREFLAMYCPFRKEIREKLAGQPIFVDAMARYNREKLKKIREIELRYHALQKDGIALTKELEETLAIYKDM